MSGSYEVAELESQLQSQLQEFENLTRRHTNLQTELILLQSRLQAVEGRRVNSERLLDLHLDRLESIVRRAGLMQ